MNWLFALPVVGLVAALMAENWHRKRARFPLQRMRKAWGKPYDGPRDPLSATEKQ